MSCTSRNPATEAEQYGPSESLPKNDFNTRQSFATTSSYTNSLDVSLLILIMHNIKKYIYVYIQSSRRVQ